MPVYAPGHASRREQPEHARQREQHAPERRHVLLPDRGRQRSAPFEELQQPLHQPGGQLERRIPGQDRRRKRERRDDRRHRGNRHRVGERSDQRYLREEEQRRGASPIVIAHCTAAIAAPRQ